MKAGEILYRDRPKYVEWKFGDFTSLMKKAGRIESPTFPFDGAEWHLTFYAGGYNSNSANSALCLTRDTSRDLENCVSVQIGIKRDNDTVYAAHSFFHVSFTANLNSRIFRYFVPVCKLRTDAPRIAPRDEVTFFCWMSPIDGGCREMETQTSENEDINELRKNLKDMLTSGEDSDVVLKVGDSEFRAHKNILRARSTVFAFMFNHDMKERRSGTVDITDCDAKAFEQFLLHVYTGKVDYMSPENVCHLYQVADKYDVQDLKTKCVDYMEENFSADTFCDVFSLALRHEESELLGNATKFFLENAENILITPKWLSFLKENPVQANELTIKTVKTLNFLVRDNK